MKKVLLLLCVFVMMFCIGCEDEPVSNTGKYGHKLQFVTENDKPFNYTENGEIKGLASDLLKEICANLNIPFEVTVYPWQDAYQKALNESNVVLFSTVLNESRKDLFKWAGPIASIDWIFYAPSPSVLNITSLDQAKNVQKIGVIKDWAIEQYLKNQGFTNLVYVNDNIEGFTKLFNREIDLFPLDQYSMEAAVNTLGKSAYAVTPILTILTDYTYFAFNKNMPDGVVADFQNEIDRLKENGTLNRLYRQYLQQLNSPSIIQVYTEQYPPLTFRNNNGEITGFGTDIVTEIMKRNKTIYPINLTLWSNAMAMILNNPNFCLFTMERIPARENLFNWVGPLGSNKTYFYTKSGSGITITSLEQAKNLSKVGTVTSWFSDTYLRELGFTNLVSDADPVVMVNKLMNGEVDAFVCSGITLPDILKSTGYNYSQVVSSFELMSTDYYIAFSKNTSSTIVNSWQNALDKIKQDGTYNSIYNKWLH
ncbi:MAG TPA: transporter substrate-binding domain-containing protein [Melioribacteraceae bacterium]|nr:transporter substrate-binding domain-containing protein [Melioribacteraceae bacterium]